MANSNENRSTNTLTPAEFTEFPSDSVTQKTECEIIARNIMTILKRTGNVFRELGWEEYKTERLKDGEFTEREAGFFDRVIGYCKTADTAQLFSKRWVIDRG